MAIVTLTCRIRRRRFVPCIIAVLAVAIGIPFGWVYKTSVI